MAADFILSGDTTQSNGGNTVDGSDTLTVQSGVTVNRTGQAGNAAINTTGGSNTVVNNGTLIGDATGTGDGALLAGDNSSMTNNGAIQTTVNAAHGIRTTGISTTVGNNGTITTTGDGSHGFSIARPSGNIYNTGTILVSGAGSHGIYVAGSSTSLTIDGKIVSENGAAILLENAEYILAMNSTAFLQGALTLGSSTSLGVNLSNAGHSIQWSFTCPACQNPPPWFSLVVYGGLPYVIDGGTISTIDPTQFTALPNATLETNDEAFAGISTRTSSLLGGNTVTSSTKMGAPPEDPEVVGPTLPRRWASAFAAGNRHAAAGLSLAYTNARAGIVGGWDWSNGPDRIFGLTLGAAQGTYAADAVFMASQRVATTTGFAGVYAARQAGKTLVDVALLGGMQAHSSRRGVNSNAVVGGIDTGIANYNGHFIAPRIALTRPLVSGQKTTLMARANAAYTFGWLDGYTETGTAFTATYAARAYQVASGGMHVDLARSFNRTTVTGSLGLVAAQSTAGQGVSGTLLGQAWTHTTTSGAAFAGQVGVAAEHRFGNAATSRLAVNGNLGTGGLTNISASARLMIIF